MIGELKGTSGTLEDLIPVEERDCNLEWIHLFSGDLANDIFLKQHCAKPWCRGCERARVWRMRDRVIRYIEKYAGGKWFFITRSIRNDLNLKTAFVDLRLAQQRFTTGFKDEKNHPWNIVTHWIGVTEITFSNKTGYNVHQHLIAKTVDELPSHWIMLLKNAWSEAAGYRAHTNVRKMEDAERAAAYVAKYMSKKTWGGLSRGRAYLCRSVLWGRNRIGCKRGTGLGKLPRDFILCCLPPVDYCAQPAMLVPGDRCDDYN